MPSQVRCLRCVPQNGFEFDDVKWQHDLQLCPPPTKLSIAMLLLALALCTFSADQNFFFERSQGNFIDQTLSIVHCHKYDTWGGMMMIKTFIQNKNLRLREDMVRSLVRDMVGKSRCPCYFDEGSLLLEIRARQGRLPALPCWPIYYGNTAIFMTSLYYMV